MALVVFLRGVNVGGHRVFRPSALARQLSRFGVVNIGAAGTFVVRRPGPKAAFLTSLREQLPFEAEVMMCDSRDIIRIARRPPFPAAPPPRDVVRFVSVLAKPRHRGWKVPMALPADGPWGLRVLAAAGRFVFGEYRRQMKAIGYLGQLDKWLGAPVTTRNWNTIQLIVKELERGEPPPETAPRSAPCENRKCVRCRAAPPAHGRAGRAAPAAGRSARRPR